MKTIKREHYHTEMVGTQRAVLWAKSGESVVFETYDCWGNADREGGERLKNPATGPLGVKGARPGDLLKVVIEKIEIEEDGYAATDDTFGYLAPLLDERKITHIPIEKGRARLSKDLSIPIDPMVGIIGVAPTVAVDNYTPHEHGGNMDCKLITQGATVFLRVQTEGALLSIGDLHATMGDGEVCVSGLEIPGRVQVQVEILKEVDLPTPFVENDRLFATLASRPTTEEALEAATQAMFVHLTQHMHLEKTTAAHLMSLGGDLKICQVVDPQITARFELSKSFFEKGVSYHG